MLKCPECNAIKPELELTTTTIQILTYSETPTALDVKAMGKEEVAYSDLQLRCRACSHIYSTPEQLEITGL